MKKAFEVKYSYLDLTKTKDAWGIDTYKHSHVEIAWEAWQAATAQQNAEYEAIKIDLEVYMTFANEQNLCIKQQNERIKDLEAEIEHYRAMLSSIHQVRTTK